MQRFLLRWAGFFVVCGLRAQSPPFVVVNAASYASAVAPDSLATIFGTGLSVTVASGVLDSTGQLPTELAGTRVEIAGTAAQLFYVSPSQINFVVPSGVNPGTVDVVVKTIANGATKTANALVASAAPGVFTSDGSGTGAGAILNAVTYQEAPFTVQTAENGADIRTRLALYGTGIRHAAKVTAAGSDPAGNRYNLTVEYAGAAPGFIGLDQVNMVLPPDLDGAGTVSLQLGADDRGANLVTCAMIPVPGSAVQLATLAVAPANVSAGDGAVLTVGLNGVARTGGALVSLRSPISAAQLASQVIIPEGKASAQTNVTTTPVPAPATAVLQAVYKGVSLNAPLEIDPASAAQLSRLTVTPGSILGGRSFTGTVTLSGPAPAAGIAVAVTSDNDAVSVPVTGTVTVPFGKSSADFEITTKAVTQPQAVVVTAAYSRVSTTAQLTVLPALQLTVDPGSVAVGDSATGTVTLGEAANSAVTITLQSTDLAVKVPLQVVVPAGQTVQTFVVTTTGPLASTRVATVTARYLTFSQTATLEVTQQAAPTLSSLVVSPNPVKGGNSAQGTLTLTGAVTVPLTVQLFAFPTSASVPATVVVPAGQKQATFPVATIVTPVAINVKITASVLNVSVSTTLTVQ